MECHVVVIAKVQRSVLKWNLIKRVINYMFNLYFKIYNTDKKNWVIVDVKVVANWGQS